MPVELERYKRCADRLRTEGELAQLLQFAEERSRKSVPVEDQERPAKGNEERRRVQRRKGRRDLARFE